MIFIVIIILIILFYYYYIYCKNTYIYKSSIHGQGLIANKEFKQGDIILEDIFPNKHKDMILYEPISIKDFNNYILLEGSKINHCTNSDNSIVYSDDNKLYSLLAKYDINKGEEILVNYDKVNKEFPFISGSNNTYVKC